MFLFRTGKGVEPPIFGRQWWQTLFDPSLTTYSNRNALRWGPFKEGLFHRASRSLTERFPHSVRYVSIVYWLYFAEEKTGEGSLNLNLSFYFVLVLHSIPRRNHHFVIMRMLSLTDQGGIVRNEFDGARVNERRRCLEHCPQYFRKAEGCGRRRIAFTEERVNRYV